MDALNERFGVRHPFPVAPGPPNRPLDHWERADMLNVELIALGWADTRVVVRFYLPRLPQSPNDEASSLIVERIIHSVKHSKPWLCAFCGAPAREFTGQTFSPYGVNPPQSVLFLHFACDLNQEHVIEGLRANHRILQEVRQGSLGPLEMWLKIPPRPIQAMRPLAGSCGYCERDNSVRETTLRRCGGCHLTRYCGKICHKMDWPKHKLGCKTIHSVSYINWESERPRRS
ncbi:hypothetical protein C8Q70DRAFT_103457 [Cubamyces menziesii]|nr:hypothetical protein C8Q70DRAFT_103457 [Cubamyces menziesii]